MLMTRESLGQWRLRAACFVSAMALGACTSGAESDPQHHEASPPDTAVEQLARQLGFASVAELSGLDEVLVTDLDECPEGQGAVRLPGVHINTYTTGPNDRHPENRRLVEMGGPEGVVRYVEDDRTVVLCGASTGTDGNRGMADNPSEGTIMVAPLYRDTIIHVPEYGIRV